MAAESAVLAAFKEFDTDDSGSISREELGEVLKSLSEDAWDDSAIDQLLSQADESGDGELQISEFVRWLFAEDLSIFKTKGLRKSFRAGDFTFLIQQSPSEELNGEYVQQKKPYGRRPVFMKVGDDEISDRFLYYHKPSKSWMINKSKSKKRPEAKLQTSRAVHLSDATWTVREGRMKMVAAEEMKAVLPSEKTPEELQSSAPPGVWVHSQWAMVSGNFIKSEKLQSDRPVYFNETDQTWIFYDLSRKQWIVAREVADQTRALVKSDETECYSPEVCGWQQNVMVKAADPNGIPLPVTVEDGFYDEEFPHSQESLGRDTKCEWISIRDPVLSRATVLFEEIEPSDVCQGGLGNCWLIAAIAGIAEFPGFIKDHLFKTKELSPEGKYEIWLYNWIEAQWQLVTIDDFIPCHPRSGFQPRARTLFAGISGDKVYASLLEKAFAKFTGSYGQLSGGFSMIAWMAMTGETAISAWIRTKQNPIWEVLVDTLAVSATEETSSETLGQLLKGAKFEEVNRIGKRICIKKLEGDGPDEGWVSVRWRGKKLARCVDDLVWGLYGVCTSTDAIRWGVGFQKSTETTDKDGMWERVLEYDRKNYLVGTHFFVSYDQQEVKETMGRLQNGLVNGHAYSFLHAVEVDGVRLVCCRNPWGNGHEWNGAWSDESEEWEAFPEIAKAVGYEDQNDGAFWMEFDDFCNIFDCIQVCHRTMPAQRDGFHAGEEVETKKVTKVIQPKVEEPDYDSLEECYIVVAGGSVKGVFLDLEKAKAELSKFKESAQPYRFIVAAQYGLVQEDPHTVAGQNQGAAMKAGFDKRWWGWPTIHEYNKIAQDYLLQQAKDRKAAAEGEQCFLAVAFGAVRGVFADVEQAKEELMKYPPGAPQPQRMVAGAQYGKIQEDPHSMAGQNQGAGMAAGFNKAWYGWDDIHKMNQIAQEYLDGKRSKKEG
ncbi:unnamed protein product [Durusdinium trenchii]